MTNPPDREPIYGKVVTGGAAARWTVGGKSYLNFSGAGYLALHDEPALRQAAYDALDSGCAFQQQLGPLYGLLDPILDAVETEAAAFMGTETALYFSSGFFIGQIGLHAFSDPADHLYVDAGAHYNLIQAAQLSGLPVTPFAHRDPDALASILGSTIGAGERPVIVTDGMFATTGELAPLDHYARAIAPFGGRIFVDDAHGFGILGVNGRGTADFFNVEDVTDMGGTLSKAFCAQGAVIGCPAETARRVNRIPPKRGANAGSPVSAAVATAALRLVRAQPERRTRLTSLAAHARHALRGIGIALSDSPSPVMAFTLGDRVYMRRVQHLLFDMHDIYLPISDYIGAGPEGVLRCAIFANHTEQDIDRLTTAIAETV